MLIRVVVVAALTLACGPAGPSQHDEWRAQEGAAAARIIKQNPASRSGVFIGGIPVARREFAGKPQITARNVTLRQNAVVDVLKRNYQCDVTVVQTDAGELAFSATNDRDSLLLEGATRPDMAPHFVIPSGAGTTYRIVGTVTRLFSGYSFTSEKAPLVFEMTDGAGLRFISGVGRVSLPDGTVIRFDG